jgi:hypothetical protein
MVDSDGRDGVTFDELLAHLDDLIALAEAEGFCDLAARLQATRTCIALFPDTYSARLDRPAAGADDPLRRSP